MEVILHRVRPVSRGLAAGARRLHVCLAWAFSGRVIAFFREAIAFVTIARRLISMSVVLQRRRLPTEAWPGFAPRVARVRSPRSSRVAIGDVQVDLLCLMSSSLVRRNGSKQRNMEVILHRVRPVSRGLAAGARRLHVCLAWAFSGRVIAFFREAIAFVTIARRLISMSVVLQRRRLPTEAWPGFAPRVARVRSPRSSRVAIGDVQMEGCGRSPHGDQPDWGLCN
ncbi:hypothetical protein MSG28_014452 [Choristoneura fumiferana]|uniref:Uncharacterized protein n=1 Tax=Choristoneura fumiferana TaxID=7141 RepID=A0ACC0JRR3_CHOFU|nr:hypothetical protein MSG28_014452 [Choristoneura fumiferana]